MAADLNDFRGKITTETRCALEAEHRVSGEDKSLIARRVLHEWAMKKLQVAKITEALLRSEGIVGNPGENGK